MSTSGNGNGESKRRRGPHGKYVEKLSEEVIETMANARRGGLAKDRLGPIAGVDPRTFDRWIAHGRNGGTRLEKDLVWAIDKADAQLVATLAMSVVVNGTPRDKLELLGRIDPANYGRRDHLVTEGTVSHKMTIDTDGMSEEEIEATLAILKRVQVTASERPEPAQLLQLPRGETG